jgi:hypothetical protein
MREVGVLFQKFVQEFGAHHYRHAVEFRHPDVFEIPGLRVELVFTCSPGMAIEFCCKSLWDRTLTSRTSAQHGEHSAATVMAANDDVFDMKSLHRKLQHRMNVGVERRCEISDVTVHEELAKREADDLVGRYVSSANSSGWLAPSRKEKLLLHQRGT